MTFPRADGCHPQDIPEHIVVRKRISRLVVISPLMLFAASGATAVTVPLESLTLSSPSDPINVLSIKLVVALLGSDSGKTNLTGTLMAELELDISSGSPVPTAITFNGGRVEASDVTFQFLRGALAVELSDIAGFPATPSPVAASAARLQLWRGCRRPSRVARPR